MPYKSFYSKYNYIRKLGQGGCGEVFLAQNKVLGNFWAVKEILKDKKTSVSGCIEPEILKRLNHPALPRICDVYEDDEKIYIIEDYLEGACLKQELDDKGRFNELLVADWAIQLCRVLEYLHGQKPDPIIYGDLKPHNIILTKEGFIKLIDFGVSAFIGNNACSNLYETTFIGTMGYAAPEQYSGGNINPASDIYSLGITLIQLITGLEPAKSFPAFDDEKIGSLIPPELYVVLRKCIETDPCLRYQSADVLLKELQNYIGLKSAAAVYCGDRADLRGFTKIIAITGERGTGVSTITAAFAEYAARGPTNACIIDLSKAASLQRAVPEPKHEDLSQNMYPDRAIKVSKNLFYQNSNNLIEINQPGQLPFYRQLARMQDRFSYIFIDTDIELLKSIVDFTDHIFFVTDMNPGNLHQMGQNLVNEELIRKITTKTSFIINKFYKGELGSRTILKSMLINNERPQYLHNLILQTKIHEVLYDPNIYLKWMYSYFDETLKYGNLINKQLTQAVSAIFSDAAI